MMNSVPEKQKNSTRKLAELVHEHYSKDRTISERQLFIKKLKLIQSQAYIEAITAMYE